MLQEVTGEVRRAPTETDRELRARTRHTGEADFEGGTRTGNALPRPVRGDTTYIHLITKSSMKPLEYFIIMYGRQ